MKKIERLLALFLAFAMMLTIFPAAAFAEELNTESLEPPTGDGDTSSPPETSGEISDSTPAETASTEALSEPPTDTEESFEPVSDEESTPPDDSTPADAAQESAEPEEAESDEPDGDEEHLIPCIALTAKLEQYGVSFTINAEIGEEFPADAILTADEDEADYETLEEICIQYGIPNILDYFSFQFGAHIPFMFELTTVEMGFETPFLRAIDETSVMVFQQTPEGFVPISNMAFVSDDMYIEHLSFQPTVEQFNGRYIIITTDRPNTLAELGTQVAYMA